MKRQFPFSRPSRAERTLLPAVAAGALVIGAGLQLLQTADPELPGQGWSGGGARINMPHIAGAMRPEVFNGESIFSPGRTARTKADGSTDALPLSGAVLVGSVSVGGRAMAVVQRSDGSVMRVAPGGTVEGARLLSLSSDGGVLLIDGRRVAVAFGARATPAASAEVSEEEVTE